MPGQGNLWAMRRKTIGDLTGSLVRETFRRMATLRHAPALHPRGLTFRAELESVDPLPEGRYDAVARLTKGAGTRGKRADVLGLAIRVRPAAGDRPWDLLLSSAGHGRVTRCIPLPARDWSTAHYSTLSPYGLHDRLFWIAAEAEGATGGHASVSELLHDAPSTFTLKIAGRTGGWLTVGRLTLLAPLTDTVDRFDPMLNCPPGWRLAPAWLRTIRQQAYQGSRHGHTQLEAAQRSEVSRRSRV
jgi:hypothetical protein